MAGSNHLFVDDGADVKAFGHAYVVDVLHFRYGFADSHAFGGKAGQDISLRVAGQGNEGFRIFQSLFHKQVHIPSVAIDNHGTVVKQLGQAVAAVQVVVHDFHLHVVRDILGGSYGNPASTHNHHVAHIGIIFLAGYFADVGDVFSCGGEVYDVM